MADASVPSVEETLAWEKSQRTRAGVAALVAGNFTLFGMIALGIVLADVPKVGLLDSIRAAGGQKLSPGVGDGLRTNVLYFYNDKSFALILVSVVLALGSIATAPVLGYLFRATSARAQRLPRVALYGALVGPILYGIAQLVLQIAVTIKAHEFVTSSNHGTAAAHDALDGGLVLVGQVLQQMSVLLVAFSFVLIALNAQRVGLLTRFMGILGMIAGVLYILPIQLIASNVPVVQCFWLIAVGFLIMDRWPGAAGRPPAWSTGLAEPWPTQQELRELREAAAAEARGETAAPKDEPVEAGVGASPPVPAPASRKRKTRKRR